MRILRAASIVTLLALPAGLANAQTPRSHLGPHLSYNFDAEKFGIGAQFSAPLARRLEFYPSADVYFVDHGSLWALNVDLKYRVPTTDRSDWLYVGGGLNLTTAGANGSHTTDSGANLILGAESLRGVVHPFGEARLTLRDGSTFQIAGGLNITLGRH